MIGGPVRPVDGRAFIGEGLSMWVVEWNYGPDATGDGWEMLYAYPTEREATAAADFETGGYPDADCRVRFDPNQTEVVESESWELSKGD